MGQQQLLLLVLGIVIVGLAVIGGVIAFNDNARRNQADDVLNRNVRVAQEAVNWRARSTIHGGGGNGSYAALATDGLETIGIRSDLTYTEHAIISASGTTLEIVGVSTSAPGVGAYVRVENSEIAETCISMDGQITLTANNEC